MNREHYKKRIIDSKVEEYLDTFGAVCIEGPKWCGKTWTSTFHCRSSIYLSDPANNFQNRRLAELAPQAILEGEVPRLIDEWQEYPPLWDAVRHQVDKRGEVGQYILTGSSTPKHKGIMHSGAGRIARLRMRPMSLYESGESCGCVSLQDICRGKLTPQLTGEVALHHIVQFIVRGGWPGAVLRKPNRAGLLSAEYLRAILEDDVYRMDGIQRNSHKMLQLLRSLARNVATTAGISKLRADIRTDSGEDIDDKTIAAYLDIFQRLYLLENQPAFSSNIRSSVRVKQAEKRHFTDPSLACSLLKATPEMLINDLNTLGILFESLCIRDLQIYADSFNARVYHYQDYKEREADAVIELPDGTWCAFEIKLGARQIDAAAAGLIKLRNSIAAEPGSKPPAVLAVICALSNAAYQREDGVYVLPLTALKP
ncbi:MAG: ATP-binding protein [Akkermansia sp.]|nr:ATP-binding protein [Akkermansia sp.]